VKLTYRIKYFIVASIFSGFVLFTTLKSFIISEAITTKHTQNIELHFILDALNLETKCIEQ